MTYDIELNEHGFMLDAGTYRRQHEGVSNSRIGRVRLFDFFGGGQRAVQLERDRFWRGVGAWPAFDSQGIVPGPQRVIRIEDLSGSSSFKPQARTWSTIWDGVCYLAQEDRVYEVQIGSGGAFDGLDHVQTLSANVTDAVATRGDWYFAHGDAAVVSAYNLDDGTYDDEALGEPFTRKTNVIGTHLGRIAFQSIDDWRADSVSLQKITDNGRDRRYVQAPIRAFVEHRGACWFVTERGLYRFTMTGVVDEDHSGDYVAEATLPQVGYADDLTWVISHMGDLWLWLGREVHRYDASNRTFEPTGLRGRATYGAASVGRYFVVVIDAEIDGLRQIWVWDGRGWWLLDEEESNQSLFAWPVALYGTVDNADLFAGRAAVDNLTTHWQFYDRPNAPGYRDEMVLTSSLLDGGERDLDRVWREIGASFAWPDDRTGTGTVDIDLEASFDGGETWHEIASGEIGTADKVFELTGAPTSATVSRYLQVRITLSGVDEWAPVLTGVWAEHETLDLPTRRLRWEMEITCSDTRVDGNGARMRPGRDQAADLWDAWHDRVVPFTDIDGEEYTVRVATITEHVGRADDTTTTVRLGLVEV